MTDLTYTQKLKDSAVKLPELTTKYKHGQLFRHVDGGFYRFDRMVYSSTDQSQKVIYDHVWPFEASGWERPIAEFEKNFKETTRTVLDESLKRDVLVVRKEVHDHRANRRALEAKSKPAL